MCSMELRALEGESKAISTDNTDITAAQVDDTDDDAMALQKSAAVLFGFTGWHPPL